MADGGWVNALITLFMTLGFDEVGQVLSPNRRSSVFIDADSFTPLRGRLAMLVHKQVNEARRDSGFAVVAGRAGATATAGPAPDLADPDAQADVLRPAYKDAGVNRAPSTTSRHAAPAPCSAAR